MHATTKDPAVKEKLVHRRESLEVGYFLFQMEEKLRMKLKLPATDPWGGAFGGA